MVKPKHGHSYCPPGSTGRLVVAHCNTVIYVRTQSSANRTSNGRPPRSAAGRTDKTEFLSTAVRCHSA